MFDTRLSRLSRLWGGLQSARPWWLLYGLIGVALLWRAALQNGIGGDFFYDEAVYANLAEHPFVSDYYPDPVFFRHPPLSYLIFAGLRALPLPLPVEITYRVSSLLFASFGLIVLSRVLDYRIRPSWLQAVLLIGLATSGLFVRYGLSATMYPLAFLALSVMLLGLTTKRRQVRDAGFTFLIYTHLWGVILFALHGLLLWRGGEKRGGQGFRQIVRDYRVVLTACAPLVALILVGLVYHSTRVHVPTVGSLAFLLIYVPVGIWLGIAMLLGHRTSRLAIWHEQDSVLLLACAAAAFFVGISLVAPPFDRYLYFFLPLFYIAGGHAISTLAAMPSMKRRAAALATGALCLLPSLGTASLEERFLANHFVDNNRFMSWQPQVEICHGSVLTNNARSFAYYLSQHSGQRYDLKFLETSGRLRQFLSTQELLMEMGKKRADFIIINAVDWQDSFVEAVELNFPECTLDGPVGPTRRYRCTPQGLTAM